MSQSGVRLGAEHFNKVNAFNIDGSLKRGTPKRPKITYNELELTEQQRRLIPKSPVEGRKRYEQSRWDRISSSAVDYADDMFQSSIREFLEIKENFQAGLARSGYDYMVTANNVSEYVADKLNLDYDEKQNFMAASANKLKNMNIQPTSTEWEDQLVYLIGMLLPDAALMLTGGGLAGASVKYGLKAATMSNRTATIGGVFARLAGDTAAGSLQMMAHEAGQAQLDGREANYAEAGRDGAVMSLALSSIGRSLAGMGFKRRYGAIATGATMYGISKAYGDPNDPAYDDTNAANAILGALFGIMTPGSHTKGPGHVLKWVKVRKERGLDVTPKAFLEEFSPHTYEKVFVDEVARDRFEFEPRVGPPRKLSPRDIFMDQLATVTDKDIHGLQDNQLVHVVMEHLNEIQLAEFKGPDGRRMSGIDSITSLKDAKIILDAISSADSIFKIDHPNYESRWAQPDTPLRYKDRVNLKVYEPKKNKKTGKVEETTTLAVEPRAGKTKETLNTIIQKRNKPKYLDIHELSWNEYAKLFGDTPENRLIHEEAIRAAAENHHPKKKKTWPNKGGLIEYGLDGEWGYLWRKPGSKDPSNPRLLDRQEPTTVKETVDILYTEHDSSVNKLTEAFKTAEGEYKAGFLEKVHKLFVDPSGDLFKILETAKDVTTGIAGVLLPVRNAFHLRYGKATRTQMKIDEVAKKIGWEDMSKEQRRDLDVVAWNRARLDDAQRHGTDPASPIESRLDIRQESRRDAIDAILARQEDNPGGIKAFEDKLRVIEDTYGKLLEDLAEHGLIAKSSYAELKKFRFIPFRTIDKAFRSMALHQKGLESQKVGPSIRKSVITDLMAKQSEDLSIMDSELLVNKHIAMVENLIADNAVHTEMAATQSHSGGLWYTKGNEPPQHLGEFKRGVKTHEYLVNGEIEPLYVDEMISKMMDGIDQERVIKGTAANFLRFISGTQFIQLTAVALNPIFGIVTHPLDVGMIMSGHPAFGGKGFSGEGLSRFLKPRIPHLFKEFYIKGTGDAGRGWAPFARNVKSAWNKDEYFVDWVNNGGVEQTLVSHYQHVEGIKKATDIHNAHAVSRRTGKSFFKALEFVGKFGHVMEVATRMTERDMLVKAGYTKKGAANESLRRLNYGMQGKAMQFIGTMIPFANAQAQILAHIGRSWTRSPESRKHAAMATAQLVGATMAYRYLMEQHFDKYMEDIPWSTRRRYFIIPTGATEVIDGVTENVFFKIKKAYSPAYTIVEGFADLAMDNLFGYREMPASVWERTYQAAEVAMPLDLRSLVPPTLKAFMAAHGTTMDGRKVYRGRTVEPRDEINREGAKGVPTKKLAILAGQVTNLSPARIQESFNSIIADNPLLWWADALLPSPPPEVQRSILAQAVKMAPIRKVVGTSNSKWRNYKLGLEAKKAAGSIQRHNVDDKVYGPAQKLWAKEYSIREYSIEMRKLARDASNMDRPKFAQIETQTIKAYRYVDLLLKRKPPKGLTQEEYREELYSELDPMVVWSDIMEIDHAPDRARYYMERYDDVDDFWKPHFEKLARYNGIFNDGFFYKEWQKLKRLRRKQQ